MYMSQMFWLIRITFFVAFRIRGVCPVADGVFCLVCFKEHLDAVARGLAIFAVGGRHFPVYIIADIYGNSVQVDAILRCEVANDLFRQHED